MAEEWRAVVGYEGLYEVSNLGRVRSLPRTDCGGNKRRGCIRAQALVYGYRQVDLYRAGKGKLFKVHRLVLEAFVGECPAGMETRHLDGDRENNRADNLAWGTKQENMRDRERHGTSSRGERHPRAVMTAEAALDAFRSEEPANVVARRLGVSSSVISQIRRGQTWAWLTSAPALCLLVGLFVGGRAEAIDSQAVLQWREPVLVTWEDGCQRPPESALVLELDTGWSRIRADLATMGVEPGPLGDVPFRPYTLRFRVAPGCPSNAPACSTRPDYREARFACLDPRGLASADHEQEHRKAQQLRLLLVRLHGAARAAYIVAYAGHHEDNDKAMPVLGVIGNERPKEEPKAKPPAPEPTPEPAVKLTKRQADVLARFPAQGWVTAQQVGADEAVLRRMVRKSVIEGDGAGRFRRAP